MQFCNANEAATGTPYPAILTVNWDSLGNAKGSGNTGDTTADETLKASANVVYTVEDTEPANEYTVNIPATITVDSSTKKGEYSVVAENFDLAAGAYVNVSATKSGSLTNGTDSVAFTNTLDSGNLTATGDTLNGVVAVTDDAVSAGNYTGTVDFTINYFAE